MRHLETGLRSPLSLLIIKRIIYRNFGSLTVGAAISSETVLIVSQVVGNCYGEFVVNSGATNLAVSNIVLDSML